MAATGAKRTSDLLLHRGFTTQSRRDPRGAHGRKLTAADRLAIHKARGSVKVAYYKKMKIDDLRNGFLHARSQEAYDVVKIHVRNWIEVMSGTGCAESGGHVADWVRRYDIYSKPFTCVC